MSNRDPVFSPDKADKIARSAQILSILLPSMWKDFHWLAYAV